jgi:hypothetical protein
MTSSSDKAMQDPHEERPDPTSEPTQAHTADLTQELWRGETAEQPPAGDAMQPASWPPPVPPRPTGPHLPAILLGLVCLVVAGVVLAQELGNLTINWGDVGPLGFVAVGAVLVVLGIVGLAGSNRRNARP